MSASRELNEFVAMRIPNWDQLGNIIESAAVMFTKKQVGEDFANNIFAPKVRESLNRLTTDELKMLENLLDRDDYMKSVVSSVLGEIMIERITRAP